MFEKQKDNYTNNDFSDKIKEKLNSLDFVLKIEEPQNRQFFVVIVKNYGDAKRGLSNAGLDFSVGSKNKFYVWKAEADPLGGNDFVVFQ